MIGNIDSSRRCKFIKIQRNIYDIFVEIICLACLFSLLIYLIIGWGSIPSEIPGHYNAAGEINRITGKGSLIGLYITTLIMYLGMTGLEKLPQMWNTGVKITEENKDRIYRILKNLMKTSKLIVVLVFTLMTINSALAKTLPGWFTPVSLVLLFGSIIYYGIKLGKNRG